jgi:hypothetical protein
VIKFLNEVQYDGGTDLENLKFPQEKYENVLFFTDGFSTLSGDIPREIPPFPVFSIINTPVNNMKYLQFFSAKTGGQCFNLLQQSVDQVEVQLDNSQKFSFLNASFEEGKIIEVLPSNPVALTSGLTKV